MLPRVSVSLATGLLLLRYAFASPLQQSADPMQDQMQDNDRADPSMSSAMDLDWTAPPECPDGGAVRAQVRRLTAGTPTRHLRARASIVAGPEAGWTLALTTEVDGTTGERTLSATSCQSLADAAALMLALILNPDLAVTTPPSEQEASIPPPPPPTPALRRHRLWRIGAQAGMQKGMLESASPYYALWVGVGTGRLSVRLAPGLTLPRDVFVRDQPALGGRLWLATLAGLGCWAAVSGAVEVSPCAGVEVTRLAGRGLGTSTVSSSYLYWSSAELALFAGLPVGHGILVEVGAVGLVALHRPAFYLTESQPITVSRPAAFAFKALGGLAWGFE